MPIKSQLDFLICKGSMQWRDLCENKTYREHFPDKDFDLEIVLEAKVCPLSVVSEKSFIGFFHPEVIEEKEGFHFLHGSMSFYNIWDEISTSAQETPRHGDSCVYIVSWNDHFFILKVEKDMYYIIDTLGERLFEGCNQAYILKFDQDTTIMQAPSESQQSDDKPFCDRKEKTNIKEAANESKIVMSTNSDDNMQENRVPEKNIIYRGKEYIKSFLAAIPIRELQVDVKKRLMASTPFHQRLQIKFHYIMSFVPKFEESSSEELIANSLAKAPSAAAEYARIGKALRGTSKGPNQKVPVLSAVTLNLADFASVAGDKQECIEIFVPLEVCVGSFKNCLSLCLVLNLVELRNTQEASETFLKFIMSAPVYPNPGKALLTDRNGGGSLKAGLRKEESEEGNEATSVQKSFSYEAPVYVNHAGGSFCSNTSSSSSDEDLVHYSHHISNTKHKYLEDKTTANQSAEQSSKCSLLSWRKRKLSFKYPKTKGKPLLKKHYGEDEADNIDFDRRQLY
ncbi:hypothetical protein P3S68_026794 [Capsicum galapagoense]